jgi:hypothetical protein
MKVRMMEDQLSLKVCKKEIEMIRLILKKKVFQLPMKKE